MITRIEDGYILRKRFTNHSEESLYVRGEFYFCYAHYKCLWAAQTNEEKEHAKSALHAMKVLYLKMHKDPITRHEYAL